MLPRPCTLGGSGQRVRHVNVIPTWRPNAIKYLVELN